MRYRRAAQTAEGRVLDLGGQAGQMIQHMTQPPELYLVVDRDFRALRSGVRNATIAFEAVCGDVAHHVPLSQAAPFDSVLMLALIEHLTIREGRAAVARAFALLRPGGTLTLTTPTRWGETIHALLSNIGLTSKHAHNEHQAQYDPKGLHHLLHEIGFTAIRIRTFELGANLICTSRRPVT